MSVSFYAGPAARCVVEKVEVERSERGCPRCRKSLHTACCPDCGHLAGQLVVRRKVQRVDVWQLFGGDSSLVADLGDGSTRLFRVNHDRGAPRRFYADEGFDLVVTAERIADEIAWFEANFVEELAELRRAYGPTLVRVEWVCASLDD